MLHQSMRDNEKYLFSIVSVEVQLYSPNRPTVDLSACFLWIMAVGTIVCASLWTEFVTCEQVDERYNQLTRKVWICAYPK
jgi:signal peptide peptidase-like 2B